jgi:hypothetical protein
MRELHGPENRLVHVWDEDGNKSNGAAVVAISEAD